MPNFLIGTSYAVSAGLIIYAIQSKYAPDGLAFPLLLLWAGFGVGLAYYAVARGRPEKHV